MTLKWMIGRTGLTPVNILTPYSIADFLRSGMLQETLGEDTDLLLFL